MRVLCFENNKYPPCRYFSFIVNMTMSGPTKQQEYQGMIRFVRCTYVQLHVLPRTEPGVNYQYSYSFLKVLIMKK